jgi:hypothetical protein
MADAERLMNLMESFDYKSEQYNVCRKVLLSHLAQKPKHDEEVEAWTMTGPVPFEFDLEFPVHVHVPVLETKPEPAPEPEQETPPKATNGKPRNKAAKRAATPKAKEPKKTSAGKPKRVRKKSTTSTVIPVDTPDN